MAIDLTKPLDDTVISAPEKSFMKNLQANILKGHGREHVALLFLAVTDVGKARTFLHQYPVTDSHKQFLETVDFQKNRTPGGVVRLVFLSKTGLDKFGHGAPFAGFATFAGGMAADAAVLDGGTTGSWQDELKQPADVMLLVAYHQEVDLARIVGKLFADIEAGGAFDVLFVQEGRAIKNSDAVGIEHFGYVDGRSQPLMIRSAIDDEKNNKGGINKYDPSAPLGQFIVSDPLDAAGFGSFFVFRKLEENVAGFNKAEAALAVDLGLTSPNTERAGAQVVGRFEDGTPLTLQPNEAGVPVVNNFDYSADVDGSRCPFHAHIRKSNPRGSSPGGLVFDKSVQMARRGITYGCRLQDPDSKAMIDQPNDGVGLLFMSYQASIDKQFRFMQTQWVNSENFPHGGVGVDPVIGEGGTLPQNWNTGYGPPVATKPKLFHGFVALKGGEYFYTPSIKGLKNL